MKIEESDFRLETVSENTERFDLELIKTVNKGKENERQEFDNAGYGLTLESALKRIIHSRIERNHPEVLTLKKYLALYKKYLNDLKELVV